MTRKITRRTVLKLGGLAGMTLAGGSSAALARTSTNRIWSRASYVPLVGQSFTVRGYRSPLRLVRIEDLRHRQAGSDRAFALIFRAPAGAGALLDGVPTLQHPSLGRFSMLLSPGYSSRPGKPFVAVIDGTHA